MIKVICVNGAKESGKSTFEDICKQKLGKFYGNRSSIDKIKEIALTCGWDGKKDAAGRRLLSKLKDALVEYNDLPINDIKKYINTFENDLDSYGLDGYRVIFCDVREPEELRKMKDEFDAICVLIVRDEAESKETSNHADSNYLDFKYDYIIDNNGTLDDLVYNAEIFLNEI